MKFYDCIEKNKDKIPEVILIKKKPIDTKENLKLKSGKYQYFKCRIYFNDEAGNFTGDMETAKNTIVLNYVQDSK